jgi:D-sedoheptulose 7-phosphate isomerase
VSAPASTTTGHMDAAERHERLAGRVEELLALRADANERFFDEAAEPLARLCHRVAERFARGGRLIAIGRTPQARSDARHVAVEFVHPVIVGKRALPAIALTGESGGLPERVELIAMPQDIAIAFGRDRETAAALAVATARGCLTVAFDPIGAEWELEPPAGDPLVRQELSETAYHLLWELVHVFFDQRGLLAGRDAGPVHDPGASSFLYPFLTEAQHDLERVMDDVRGSIRSKAHEIGALRVQTLREGRDTLIAAATELRERLDAGATVLALGNGGSATDAMDAVADLCEPPAGWIARRAIDLTEDTAILTAIANDIGVEAIFQRQVIAHGREGDVLLALSTSGDSVNVIDALAEARKRGLATIAMVGYDGGRMAADELADHVLVTRSQNIPRIQEAQASALHVLRTLLEEAA